MKTVKELLEDLEMLIINNEDDFDRGKGKHILREFISSINSASNESLSVRENEDKKKKCKYYIEDCDNEDNCCEICQYY
jgi:hypothetical protein